MSWHLSRNAHLEVRSKHPQANGAMFHRARPRPLMTFYTQKAISSDFKIANSRE